MISPIRVIVGYTVRLKPDVETAQIAIEASLTGHLVLSTLHCNDATHALVRLQDLGLAPFHVATCLRLITAQRLVRRLCPACRTQAARIEAWEFTYADEDSRRLAEGIREAGRLPD